MKFMNTKFISDTIIDTEYSKLGIMDINPSRSTIMVIAKTCINDNIDNANTMHLESGIYGEEQKIHHREKRTIFGFFSFILVFINALLAINLNININNNNNNLNNNNMN